MRQWQIDPEFRDLLPPCGPEADQMLEEELLQQGRPKDPIVIWKGHDIIVDGHRRYDICMRNGLPFTFLEMEFSSREEVISWMEKHQVMRRNLSPVECSLLLARMVGRRMDSGMSKNTAVTEVAGLMDKSERHVRRAQEVAEKVDSIDPSLRPTASRLSVADIDRVLGMPEDKKAKVAEKIAGASTKEATKILEKEAKKNAKPPKKPERGMLESANNNGADLLKVCLYFSRKHGDEDGMKECRFHMRKILDKLIEWADDK
jgi:hypothetical protein